MGQSGIIQRAWRVAEAFLKEGTHGMGHVRRVYRLATEICQREGGNLFAVQVAAILHDIARPIEDITGWDHAEVSAEIAKRLLRLWGVSEDIIATVYDAIYSHRFSKGRIPKTLEGKILSDADKLDALGAIGIARVFKHNPNRPIEDDIQHFHEKILKLPSLMHTPTAKQLASQRVKIIQDFLRQLEGEMGNPQ